MSKLKTLKCSHELKRAITRPFSFVIYTHIEVNSLRRWKAWYQHHILLNRLSIRIPRMVAQSWRSQVLTLVSLLVIQGNPRGTAYKHDTRPKCSDCMSAPSFVDATRLTLWQNRQGCTCCKWLCCRREHVREKSPATFRGVYTTSAEVLDNQSINISGIGTLMRKICPFMLSRVLFKQCFMLVVSSHTMSTIF
jgi:hypothetical protein